jgi:hypothetical protein
MKEHPIRAMVRDMMEAGRKHACSSQVRDFLSGMEKALLAHAGYHEQMQLVFELENEIAKMNAHEAPPHPA